MSREPGLGLRLGHGLGHDGREPPPVDIPCGIDLPMIPKLYS